MTDRIAQVIVIAEDGRSAQFLRRYVQRAVSYREIRVQIAPKGQQSAYDWVIAQYPKEVAEQRHRVSPKSKNIAALAVHVDADTNEVEQRMRQLADALQAAHGQSRQRSERIAIAIPKRNIETWLHGLCDIEVDETYDFKRDVQHRIATNQRQRDRLCNQRIGPAVNELYRLTRKNAPSPPGNMPSVATTVTELRRLET